MNFLKISSDFVKECIRKDVAVVASCISGGFGKENKEKKEEFQKFI